MKAKGINKRNINLIKKIKIVDEYKEFREIIFQLCLREKEKNPIKIMDIGKSSRNYSSKFKEISSEYVTASQLNLGY